MLHQNARVMFLGSDTLRSQCLSTQDCEEEGHLQTDRENFQTESQYFMLLHMHVTKTGTGSDIYLSLFRSQT